VGEDGVDISLNAKWEVYGVRNKVWAAAGMKPKGGCLCIGCLEKRLGRKLTAKDFPRAGTKSTIPTYPLIIHPWPPAFDPTE
jgi:hypothetical protein